MFLLIVNLTFNNLIDRDFFIEKFNILKNYCNENEKFLLQFELGINDKYENEIIIIEKYDNKENYLNIHRKSNEFYKVKEHLNILKPIIKGQSYII